ncbi:YnbE family lipoprotein [Lonsdalea quercina]|uniref:YnbE family lipoprotein n=1 Tax=Lonsdalea quercina TaxID=71657 RepID=UPI003F46CFB3
MHDRRAVLWLTALFLTGCTPRIEVTAPETPITINMNVKIDHDIHIKADPEATQLLEKSDTGVAEQIKKARRLARRKSSTAKALNKYEGRESLRVGQLS